MKEKRIIKISAYHPTTGSFLCSMSRNWEHLKAIDGFYSNKIYMACKKSAYLTSKFIGEPLGIKKPVIKISWLR